MKTKPRDVPYCGVRKEVIEKAKPVFDEEILKYHHHYIFERHRIYKKKEIEKLPPPWTEDEIFQKYRFTNVRRELDRETKWVINNIVNNDNFSLIDKLYYIILFRVINKSESIEKLEFLKYPIEKLIDVDFIRPIIEEKMKSVPKDYAWFSNAFYTSGFKSTWRYPSKYLPELNIKGIEENVIMRMIYILKYAYNKKIPEKSVEAENQCKCFELLNSVPGLGQFIAYQIFVDYTYIPDFPFSENEFTIAGPGCQRGIDFMFKDKDGMTYEECIFWCRDNLVEEWKKRGWEYDLNELFDHLPEYDRCLNVMMLENSFCELSKYTKAKKGLGRPKNNYKPRCDTCKLEPVKKKSLW